MRLLKGLLVAYQSLIVASLVFVIAMLTYSALSSSGCINYRWGNLFLGALIVVPTFFFSLCNVVKSLLPKLKLFHRWKSLTPISVVFTVLFTAGLAYLGAFETDWGSAEMTATQTTSFELGQDAPDFTAKDQFGQKLSMSGLRGKIVLLDFWATWEDRRARSRADRGRMDLPHWYALPLLQKD